MARLLSFNGALASAQPGTLSPGPFQQFNCIINTVLSLLGATVATFIASPALTGKLDMVSQRTLESAYLEFPVHTASAIWHTCRHITGSEAHCFRRIVPDACMCVCVRAC